MPNDSNPCNWPDFCGPPLAREMLDEIAARAQQEIPKQTIDPDVQIRILDRVHQCKSPFLRNQAGTHVCDLKNPLPCDELTSIWKRTAPDVVPADPKSRPGHWLTIAQDLESFPTGS